MSQDERGFKRFFRLWRRPRRREVEAFITWARERAVILKDRVPPSLAAVSVLPRVAVRRRGAGAVRWYTHRPVHRDGGDESFLARVAAYGHQGALRTDRDDRPTGILNDTWERYPAAAFAAEQTRLAKALRDLSLSRPPGTKRIHFFGFDIDALAGGGYEDLAELLHPVQDAPPVAEIRALLARLPGETVAQRDGPVDPCPGSHGRSPA